MRLHRSGLITLAGLSLSLLASAAWASSPGGENGSDPLVVHEWGTFLTMNGSDGVVLDSMYHEEHALPDFVHALSADQLRQPELMLKFETPVIYFYTNQPRTVEVTARFPTGIWTHWFPQAATVHNYMRVNNSRPSVSQSPASGGKPFATEQSGFLHWKADLIPASENAADLLPKTDAGSLWNFARQVDAAYVRTRVKTDKQAKETKEPFQELSGDGENEYERYLFYRGLGHATLPLEADTWDGGSLHLSPNRVMTLKHLFIMRVEGGKGVFRYVPTLKPGERLEHIIPDMAKAEPLSDFSAHVGDALAARLEESGLYPKEARAMVNTWRSSYFQSEGVRVLYVLPQSWTETFIPLQITPRPEKLVRVMVGRTELLTPERESQIAAAVRDYTLANSTRRDRALNLLHVQGRYIEPILRRLLHTTTDTTVRDGCRRLLLTDWVNELRPANPAITQK